MLDGGHQWYGTGIPVESCHDEVSSLSLFQSAFTWENGMQAVLEFQRHQDDR